MAWGKLAPGPIAIQPCQATKKGPILVEGGAVSMSAKPGKWRPRERASAYCWSGRRWVGRAPHSA
jgi:hypothetical protein